MLSPLYKKRCSFNDQMLSLKGKRGYFSRHKNTLKKQPVKKKQINHSAVLAALPTGAHASLSFS